MTNQELLTLIHRFNKKEASPEEQALLETWYVKQDALFHQELPEGEIAKDLNDIYASLPRKKGKIILWQKITIAAVVLIAISFSLYYAEKKSTFRSSDHFAQYKDDIKPGTNRATLTLADAKVIVLDDKAQGKIAEQPGLSIMKNADGILVYSMTGKHNTQDMGAYNTLRTPRGGQFLIVLQDGSRAWLNAASELRFPLDFGSSSRHVDLKGEAYFEIAKDPKRPFLVNSIKQQIEVLGTHFNVNAYSDEPTVKTTLLEGSVKIEAKDNQKATIILKPNDRVIYNGENFKRTRVEASTEVAWVNGKFVFNDEPLESILRKISRWYDLQIEYRDNKAKSEIYGGMMSRFDNVAKVLAKLEATGDVRFEIEKTSNKGYKVIVYKK